VAEKYVVIVQMDGGPFEMDSTHRSIINTAEWKQP
jgi:hypothetical protein